MGGWVGGYVRAEVVALLMVSIDRGRLVEIITNVASLRILLHVKPGGHNGKVP